MIYDSEKVIDMLLIISEALIDHVLAHIKTIQREFDKIVFFGYPIETEKLLALDSLKVYDQDER